MSDNFGNLADELFQRGEQEVDANEFGRALSCFRQAWDALPEPKDEQPLAIQIQAGISDCEFFLGQWEACHAAMQQAVRCGLELDNVFARLRLGQSLFELGNLQEAANWLAPVYLMHGREPFEHNDPKYLEFFRSQLAPPGGDGPKDGSAIQRKPSTRTRHHHSSLATLLSHSNSNRMNAGCGRTMGRFARTRASASSREHRRDCMR